MLYAILHSSNHISDNSLLFVVTQKWHISHPKLEFAKLKKKLIRWKNQVYGTETRECANMVELSYVNLKTLWMKVGPNVCVNDIIIKW